MENLQTALMLLAIGMITVFVVLLFVVLVGKAIIIYVNKYYPEEAQKPIAKKAARSVEKIERIIETTEKEIKETAEEIIEAVEKVVEKKFPSETKKEEVTEVPKEKISSSKIAAIVAAVEYLTSGKVTSILQDSEAARKHQNKIKAIEKAVAIITENKAQIISIEPLYKTSNISPKKHQAIQKAVEIATNGKAKILNIQPV